MHSNVTLCSLQCYPLYTHNHRSEGNLTEEEREQCVKNMFAEFLSTHDVKEALTRAKELLVDGYGPTLVELGVEKLLDTPKEKEQSLLCKLLVQLAKIGTVTPDAFLQGYGEWSKQLEDIRCGMRNNACEHLWYCLVLMHNIATITAWMCLLLPKSWVSWQALLPTRRLPRWASLRPLLDQKQSRALSRGARCGQRHWLCARCGGCLNVCL